MSLVVYVDRSTEPVVKLLNRTCHGSSRFESIRTAAVQFGWDLV